MSQVEKFQAREAKAAKHQKDEEVVRETELKNSTLDKRAGRVAKQYGYSTEDIFMIIARDSAQSWMKMWNNSMENVIRETIRQEVQPMIQEAIQQELASAVRGFIKGMTEFSQEQIAETVQEEIQIAVNPESQFKNGLQQLQEKRTEAFESKLNEMKQETDEYVKNLNLDVIPVELIADEKTRIAVIEAHQAGIDPVQVNKFKKFKPTCNTVYQRFTRKNKGIKGAWKQYVDSVIEYETTNF